jgi:hypothetical protein
MRWWLLFLLIPNLLIGKEISWKKEEKNCMIAIQLNANETALYKPIKMEITLTHPLSYQINIQDVIQPILWPLNPLQPIFNVVAEEVQALLVQDQWENQVILTMVPLVTGTFDLSLLIVSFLSKQPEKSSVQILTPIFPITVTPATQKEEWLSAAPLLPITPFPMGLSLANLYRQNDPEKLDQEAKRNQEILEHHTLPWTWMVAIFFLIGSGFAGKKLRQVYNKKQTSAVIPDAIEMAREDLRRLKQQRFVERGFYETYYIELSRIIRHYIEKKFQIRTKSQTTEEFLQEITLHPVFSSPFKHSLNQFLQEADRIKFAQYQPSEEACNKAYEKTVELLKIEIDSSRNSPIN